MKDIKYIKMGESEIVLSYDSKTKLISVDVVDKQMRDNDYGEQEDE